MHFTEDWIKEKEYKITNVVTCNKRLKIDCTLKINTFIIYFMQYGLYFYKHDLIIFTQPFLKNMRYEETNLGLHILKHSHFNPLNTEV